MPASLLASLLTFVVMALLHIGKTWSSNVQAYGEFVTGCMYLAVIFNAGFYYINEAALEVSQEELATLEPVKKMEYSLRVLSQLCIINLWVLPIWLNSMISVYFTLCALYVIILLWDRVVKAHVTIGVLFWLDVAGLGLSVTTAVILYLDHHGFVDLMNDRNIYSIFSILSAGYVALFIISIVHLKNSGKSLKNLLKLS